jgi:hypothetical protein
MSFISVCALHVSAEVIGRAGNSWELSDDAPGRAVPVPEGMSSIAEQPARTIEEGSAG